MTKIFKTTTLILAAVLFATIGINAQELKIGTATTDISPKLPVALFGQFENRIAHSADTPLKASVIALESTEGNRSLDAAIMVSCDLLFAPDILLKMVRAEVHKQIPVLDVSKIFLNATHAHTAPVLENGEEQRFQYNIPKTGVTQPEEYVQFFSKQVSDAIVRAWNTRAFGSASWGLSQATIGYNRRAVYFNGRAQLYGATNRDDFSNLEGLDDHDVNSLFFWNDKGKIIGMAVDIPCPAQEMENGKAVNADFWHPVREKLKKVYGKDICVVAWTGAAGDQSPHLMYRKAADDRMNKLANVNRIDAIAKRIVDAITESYNIVKKDRHTNLKFVHKTEVLQLPMQIITEAEYLQGKAEFDKFTAELAADPTKADNILAFISWNKGVIQRYEKQKENPNPKMNTEIHVLRIGDIAVCTNQFELYSDFGIRIQTRSKALQTFVVQLAGAGSYLPTGKAFKGGSYSAVCQSILAGPEGGQVLVNRSLELINEMFPEVNKPIDQYR
jgi:hypothetical protein